MESQNPSVVSQVVNAVETTVQSPTPMNLLNDVQTALSLFAEFKAATAGLHPTVWDIIKLLL